MGSLSNWAENKVLDFVLRGTSFAQSTHLYVALCTSNPGETATGGTLPEPTNGWYSRQQCDSWSTAASRATANSNALTWTAVDTASETITHFAIVDSSSGSGNVIASGAVAVSKTFQVGDIPKFAASAISVSFATGGVNNYLANKLLDHIFKNTAYTAPSLFLALSTANPTDAGSGTAEPSDGSYVRKSTAFDVASAGATANTNTDDFATATASWGTITYVGLRDASSGGNALMYAALTTSKAVGANDVAEFAAAALTVTAD